MVSINLRFVMAALALSVASSVAAPSAGIQGNTFTAPSVIPSIWKSVGAALGTDSLTYTMSLKGQNMDGLTQRMTQIAESNGEWLSKEDLKQYASVSDQGRTAITNYLKAQGLKESDFTFSPLGDEVQIKSSISTAAKMLAAEFESFLFQGKDKASRTKQYTVDASIADFVTNIHPIADFQEIKVPNLSQQRVDARSIQDRADAPAGCDTAKVTPQCLRNLYGTSAYTPSKGTTDNVDVAIMEYIGQYTSQSDLTKFLKTYRPDAAGYKIPIKNSMGAVNLPLLGAGVEAMLDVETVVAQTYPLQSTVYNLGNQLTQGDIFLLTFQMFIKASSQPGVITISYGGQESDVTKAQADDMCNAAQKLSALGTTIFISSGDAGVASSDTSATCPPFAPTYPGGCPYITSVGATENFTPEKAVGPDVGGFYSGAGVSNLFPAPDFQKAVLSAYLSGPGNAAPEGAYNTTGRGYPDVSAQGSKYAVIVDGQAKLVGGTSAAAPTFASVFALVNDARKKAGKGRAGWINPTLYKNPSALTDLTTGSSLGCGASNTGFNATSGYDLATGLGTPQFAALLTTFGV